MALFESLAMISPFPCVNNRSSIRLEVATVKPKVDLKPEHFGLYGYSFQIASGMVYNRAALLALQVHLHLAHL